MGWTVKLGMGHPDTIKSQLQLRQFSPTPQRQDQACSQFEAFADSLQRSLGTEHPKASRILRQAAIIMAGEVGDYKSGLELYRESQTLLKKILEPKNHKTIKTT